VRGNRGVTLIELMISITLVAAIITGLLLAMRTSLLAYDRVNQRLEENRRAVGMEQTLERQIGGVIPIVGDCGTARIPLFGGDQQSLRFLSQYSLAEGSRGYPRILEYQVAPDPSGGVRLMMNERLYGGPSTIGPLCSGNVFLPVQLGPESIQAVGRLAFCRFAYREFLPDALLAGNWFPSWTRPALPGAVRVEMAPLDPAASRMPMLTLNVPVRITRDLGVPYVDQ
jgi:prepilin-type N-terminal cleavage/methylation domain-containing protein